jgi:hypothetical protein
MKMKFPLEYAFPLLVMSLICGTIVIHCLGVLWADYRLHVTVRSPSAEGVLITAQGEPVKGAKIETFVDSSIQSATTNSEGKFRFSDYVEVDRVNIEGTQYKVGPRGISSAVLVMMTGVSYSAPGGLVVISYERWSGYIVIALLFGSFAWLLEAFISKWRQPVVEPPARGRRKGGRRRRNHH